MKETLAKQKAVWIVVLLLVIAGVAGYLMELAWLHLGSFIVLAAFLAANGLRIQPRSKSS